MQYSLRSLLISFAVAGTGAAVFCSDYVGPYSDPPPAAVVCVVVMLFGATLLGLTFARKKSGILRAGWCLAPPALATLALVPTTQWLCRALLAANGTAAAGACKSFAEAEEIYHRADWNKDGVLEYAPTLKELSARKLIEQGVADAEWPSSKPFHGYFFKVLTKQKRPIERSFLDDKNRLTRGYAIVAWPARYEWTGHDLFMISNSGIIWQLDYGPDNSRGDKMTEFDPPRLDGWGCE